MPCTDRRKREKTIQKKNCKLIRLVIQMGTERKEENPLFLYCNRSVEKRVCVCVEFWKWRRWKPSNRNKDVNEGRDNDKPIR
jgi:hypothetical protein